MFRMLNYGKQVVRPGWYVQPLTNWLYPRLRGLPLGPRWIAGPTLVILTAVIAIALGLLLMTIWSAISTGAGWTSPPQPGWILFVDLFLILFLVATPLFSGIQMASKVAHEGQARSGDLRIKTVTDEQYKAGMERWRQTLANHEHTINGWHQAVAEHNERTQLAMMTNDMSLMPPTLNVPACVTAGRAGMHWRDCPSPHMCEVHRLALEFEMDDASCLIIDNVDDRNIIRPPLDVSFPPVPLHGKAARGLGTLIVTVVPWVVGIIATWLTVAAVADARLIGLLDGTVLDPGADASTTGRVVRTAIVFVLVGVPFVLGCAVAYAARRRSHLQGSPASTVFGFIGTLCLWIAMAMVLVSLTVVHALHEGRASSFNFDPPQVSLWPIVLMTGSALLVAVLSESRWNQRQGDQLTTSLMTAV